MSHEAPLILLPLPSAIRNRYYVGNSARPWRQPLSDLCFSITELWPHPKASTASTYPLTWQSTVKVVTAREDLLPEGPGPLLVSNRRRFNRVKSLSYTVYSNATLKLAPQHRLWQRTGQLGATLIERFGAKLDMNRPAQFKARQGPCPETTSNRRARIRVLIISMYHWWIGRMNGHAWVSIICGWMVYSRPEWHRKSVAVDDDIV